MNGGNRIHKPPRVRSGAKMGRTLSGDRKKHCYNENSRKPNNRATAEYNRITALKVDVWDSEVEKLSATDVVYKYKKGDGCSLQDAVRIRVNIEKGRKRQCRS